MDCIVTAGPTYEPLDEVRRLTNFSTGRLGAELAGFLTGHGHNVTLLIGEQATYAGERKAKRVETFTTTGNLSEKLQALAGKSINAVFHTAAVSDFAVGKIWHGSPGGRREEIKSRKIPTRDGTLLVELAPTPKIITHLRGWFPRACLVGWKYEVEGSRADAIRAAERQISECATDASVVNGPAYGAGFGVVRTGQQCVHVPDAAVLFHFLAQFVEK